MLKVQKKFFKCHKTAEKRTIFEKLGKKSKNFQKSLKKYTVYFLNLTSGTQNGNTNKYQKKVRLNCVLFENSKKTPPKPWYTFLAYVPKKKYTEIIINTAHCSDSNEYEVEMDYCSASPIPIEIIGILMRV